MSAVPDRRKRVLPVPGQVVFVGPAASVQFAGRAAFQARVISFDERPTYDGWIWCMCYQLRNGEAVERRSIYVQIAGLRSAEAPGGTGTATTRADGRRRAPRAGGEM